MEFTNLYPEYFEPVHSQTSTMKKSTRVHPYLRPQTKNDSGLDGNTATRRSRRNNSSPYTPVADPSNPSHFCPSVSPSVTQEHDVNEEAHGNPETVYRIIVGDGISQLNVSRPPSDPAGTYYGTQTSPSFDQAAEIFNTPKTSFIPHDYYGSNGIIYQSQNQNSVWDPAYLQQEPGHLGVATPDVSFNNEAPIKKWDGEEYFLQSQPQVGYVDSNVCPPQDPYYFDSKPNIKNEPNNKIPELHYLSTGPSFTYNDLAAFPTNQENSDFNGFQYLPPYSPYYEYDTSNSYAPLAEPRIVPTHQEFEKPVGQEEESPKFLNRIPAASSRGTTGTKKRSGEKKKGTIVNKKIERKIAIHGPKPTQKDWLARAYGWEWLKPTSRGRALKQINQAKGRMYENVHKVEVEEDDLPLLSCPVEGCTTQCRGTKNLQLHFKSSTDLEKDPGHALVINNVKEQPKITCIASDCDAKIARGGMFRHLSEFHNSVWIYCTMCDHKNTREGNVRTHFRDMHTGEELPMQFREIVHHEIEYIQPAAEPCNDEPSSGLLTNQACDSADVQA